MTVESYRMISPFRISEAWAGGAIADGGRKTWRRAAVVWSLGV